MDNTGAGGRRVRRAWTTVALIAAVASAAVADPAVAGTGPTGPIIGVGAPAAIPGSYIVVLKDSPATEAGVQAAATVRAAATTIARRYHATTRHTYNSSLHGFSMTADEATARRLAADPAVRSVHADLLVAATDTQANPPSWGLDRVDQRQLPLSGTYAHGSAAGVTAYVLDSGVRITHADFGGRASYGWDTIDNDAVASDCHGHGTHVAGTIGGTAFGVAKNVNLVAVRVLNCAGVGSYSQIIAGIEWITTNVVRPAVVNVSLGGGLADILNDAVRASVATGITYVIAAGNDNHNACLNSPGSVSEAVTVAATDTSDARASFSNYGSCVDIFAPGVSIRSDSRSGDGTTTVMSGTSMAAPHVAGAAALLLGEDGTRTPAEIQSLLLANAGTGLVGNRVGSPDLLLRTADGVPARATILVSQPAAASRASLAVWRPPTGTWYTSGQAPISFGVAGDIPVPGHYNRDRVLDVAVWRPATGTWWIRGVATIAYGQATDQPTPGDYNRDGQLDIAVWRPSNGTWYIRGGAAVPFGATTDVAVPADYNGDGRTDIAVWRPGNGTWYIRGVGTVTFGAATDIAVPADYNGDGRTDIAVWRPSNGTWYIRGVGTYAFGGNGDLPASVRSSATATP